MFGSGGGGGGGSVKKSKKKKKMKASAPSTPVAVHPVSGKSYLCVAARKDRGNCVFWALSLVLVVLTCTVTASDVDDLRGLVEKQGAMIDQQGVTIDQQGAMIDQLVAQGKEQGDIIAHLVARVEKQDGIIDQQDGIIDQQNATMDQQNATIQQLHSDIDRQHFQNLDTRRELASLQVSLSTQRNRDAAAKRGQRRALSTATCSAPSGPRLQVDGVCSCTDDVVVGNRSVTTALDKLGDLDKALSAISADGSLIADTAIFSAHRTIQRDIHQFSTNVRMEKAYYHMKTSATAATMFMFRFEVVGFAFGVGDDGGDGNIDSALVGYRYPTGSTFIGVSNTNVGHGSMGVYLSADNHIVVYYYSADSYYLGLSLSVWTVNPPNTRADVQILETVLSTSSAFFA